MSETFDFIDAYKRLLPNETRETYQARLEAHAALLPSVGLKDRLATLVLLAFSLPLPPERDLEWMASEVRSRDGTFSIKTDHAERARIASLLLSASVDDGSSLTQLAIATASAFGTRAAADPELVGKALAALARHAEAPLRSTSSTGLKFPELVDRKSDWEDLEASADIPIQVGTDVIADVETAGAKFADDLNRILENNRTDTLRLTAEMDMLWWAVSDWSDLLGKERKKVGSVPIVSGIELAEFVSMLPGPHGVAAILRRVLGASHEKQLRLSEAARQLKRDEFGKLLRAGAPAPAPIFPLLTYIAKLADGTPDSDADLVTLTGLDPKQEITLHQLAMQAYRERLLQRAL